MLKFWPTVSAFEVKIGDCLVDTFADEESFQDVNAVPRSQPHAFEAYHSEDVSGDTFPTNLGKLSDEICYVAFEGYVGVSIEETVLTFMSLIPTRESWEKGSDREVTCLVAMSDGSDMIGALRNSR